jgi:hypothetical protein
MMINLHLIDTNSSSKYNDNNNNKFHKTIVDKINKTINHINCHCNKSNFK